MKKGLPKSQLGYFFETQKWKNRLNNLRKIMMIRKGICQRIGLRIISGEFPSNEKFEA